MKLGNLQGFREARATCRAFVQYARTSEIFGPRDHSAHVQEPAHSELKTHNSTPSDDIAVPVGLRRCRLAFGDQTAPEPTTAVTPATSAESFVHTR